MKPLNYSINNISSEMTQEELRDMEEEEFNAGPLSILTQSVKNNTQILISCRNNKKLLARVRALYSLILCSDSFIIHY